MVKRITSPAHPIVQHLVKLRTNGKYRTDQGSCVVTGRRLVHEVCTHAKVLRVLWSDESLRPPHAGDWEKIETTEEIVCKIAGVPRCEGIAAEVALPGEQLLENPKRLLICDDIRDPGNLGTLLRTAWAFGWSGVCLIGGVDPFNDKVIRASRGALFTLPYWRTHWHDFITELPLFAADMHGMPIDLVPAPERLGLILSHESQGLSPSSRQRATLVSIPMKGQVESLNVAVAGAIALYQWQPAS
jgi:TrmH family RNA methyltransferase